MCLGLLMGTAQARPKLFWPGYIDNSECLEKRANNGPAECGWSNFAPMNNGTSTVFQSNEMEFVSIWRKLWSEYAFNTSLQSQLNYMEVFLTPYIEPNEYHSNVDGGVTKENGIPLYTQDKVTQTKYLLKGFGADKQTIKVRYKKCTKINQNYSGKDLLDCKFDSTWHYLPEISFDSLLDPSKWGGMVSLGKFEGIGAIEVIMGSPDFRIALRGEDHSDVRSLYMPAIKLKMRMWPKNVYGTSIFANHLESSVDIIPGRPARLNQRQCTLDIKPIVDFGTEYLDFEDHFVGKNQTGKLGREIATNLRLNCGKYQESLIVGGHTDKVSNAGKYVYRDVVGNWVTHYVRNVKITPTEKVNIEGQDRIGLKNGTTNQVATNLYVEGSLSPNQECGYNPLKVDPIGNNQGFASTIKANPRENGDIDWFNYSTIYWKLCKTPGRMDAGKYRGNATVTIEYQ